MAYTARSLEEVVHLLKDGRGAKSLTDFADELGVSKQYLSNVFNGNAPPSDRLLEKFGYRREPGYVQIKQEERKEMTTATKIGCAHCSAEFDTDDQLMEHARKNHADKLRRPAVGTKQQTIVSVILDKSGSMASKVQDVIGGFNTYVDELGKDSAADYRFTLTLFDTQFVEKYLAQPLSAVQHLDEKSYRPDGNTALNDAIGRTIRLIEGDNPDGKVIVVIMTDGEENSSREYSINAVKDLIQAKEKVGWSFIFLGASPSAWAQGVNYGISPSNVAYYDQAEYRGTFQCAAFATAATSSGSAPSTASFSTIPDKMLRSANLQVNPGRRNTPSPKQPRHKSGSKTHGWNPTK